jgi:hypothetical protein
MTLDALKADIVKSKTEVLRQRYDLYQDLKSLGVRDIVMRDLLELELARRGVFEDLGPYRTVNS